MTARFKQSAETVTVARHMGRGQAAVPGAHTLLICGRMADGADA